METESANGLTATPDFPLLMTGPLWLFIFLVLVLGAFWWWQRQRSSGLRSRSSDLSIQILATRPLGPRAHLAIVEAAGQRSLIATTAQGVHYLRDLPAEADDGKPSAAFAQHLTPGEDPSRP